MPSPNSTSTLLALEKDINHTDSVAAVKNLCAILVEADLQELEYRTASFEIKLVKNKESIGQLAHLSHHVTPVPYDPAPIAEKPNAPKPSTDHHVYVTSPLVGTAYLAPSPGSDPFIKVGDMIKQGQVLMIIEAMKVMNPIKSTQQGKVAEICISDGTPVEFGEKLVRFEL